MVYVHLAEGFEEIEALTVVDLMRRAQIDVQTVAMGEDKTVTGAHGIAVQADILQEEADYSASEMLVLPGGMPGTTHLMENEMLGREIQNYVQIGRWVAAICAAPMVLGHLGVLEGKQATIYPGMEMHLIGATPIHEQKVVKDGRIITSKGPGTAMDFALALVEELKGKSAADELRGDLVFG
jgi:4-methyl-5(b-hydroxyethyl)-thiazole monophosphate biosynthesis